MTTPLYRLLKVARSSFYARLAAAKARAARKAAGQDLVHEITVIHVASRHTYGVPRIHAELPWTAGDHRRLRAVSSAAWMRSRSMTRTCTCAWTAGCSNGST
ncbi:hypothetical protein ACGFN1_16955 [Streptomyces sp. NPDC048685]|uniref:hypothetical protein n=1 Tax=Streptomyces sp. NPDC048685 TaxID=3365584 RepID=UPI00371EA4FB